MLRLAYKLHYPWYIMLRLAYKLHYTWYDVTLGIAHKSQFPVVYHTGYSLQVSLPVI